MSADWRVPADRQCLHDGGTMNGRIVGIRTGLVFAVLLCTTLVTLTASTPNLGGTAYGSSNPLLTGQCTWFVFGRLQETGLVQLQNLSIFRGNAATWLSQGASANLQTGTAPRPGAVAVWKSVAGGLGHVAFVEAATGTASLSESNFLPRTGNLAVVNTGISQNESPDHGRCQNNLAMYASDQKTVKWCASKFAVLKVTADPGTYVGWFALQETVSPLRTGWAWRAKRGDADYVFTRIDFGTSDRFYTGTPDGYVYPYPVLVSPPDQATQTSLSPTLQWKQVAGAQYRIQISRDAAYRDLVKDQAGLQSTSFLVPIQLQPGTTYHWRVAFGSFTDWQGWGFTTTSGSNASVTRVSPNPVPGSGNPQTLTIYGSGFRSGATAKLRDLSHGGEYTKSTAFVGSGQLTLAANFTNTTATWSVTVTNPGGTPSNSFSFQVQRR
jgi:surface antigen